jgi:hypothetical protein
MKRIAMMVMVLAAGLSLATGVFAQNTGGNSHGKQNACAHSHGHAHGCSGAAKVKGTPDATEAAEATDTPDNDTDNDSNGKGHPNNHGSAVSAVAQGTCTAPNPHHPATSNHGMCVSAAAHGNNGKTKQGKKSKTAKSKSKH